MAIKDKNITGKSGFLNTLSLQEGKARFVRAGLFSICLMVLGSCNSTLNSYSFSSFYDKYISRDNGAPEPQPEMAVSSENIAHQGRNAMIRDTLNAPSNLANFSEQEVYDLLQAPDLVREEAGKKALSYRSASCALDIFVAGDALSDSRVYHYEFRHLKEGGVVSEMFEQACLRSILSHHS